MQGTKKQRMVAFAIIGLWVPVVLANTGCTAPKPAGPSYAEALQIYNGELESLERLRQQRQELQEQLKGSPVDAVGAVLGLGGDLQRQQSEALEGITDPNELLDQVADQSAGLLDRVAEGLESAGQVDDETRKEIEAKIDELDVKIAEQQKRVDRAQADRDAADAARK